MTAADRINFVMLQDTEEWQEENKRKNIKKMEIGKDLGYVQSV